MVREYSRVARFARPLAGSALTLRYVDTITLTGAGEEGTFHCGTDVFVGEHRAVVAERTRSSSDSDW